MRGFAHHTVSRICDHRRGWNRETRVVCEGHPVVHKSEILGCNNHLARLRQIHLPEAELRPVQLIKDLYEVHRQSDDD
jgi:hypothetical protein